MIGSTTMSNTTSRSGLTLMAPGRANQAWQGAPPSAPLTAPSSMEVVPKSREPSKQAPPPPGMLTLPPDILAHLDAQGKSHPPPKEQETARKKKITYVIPNQSMENGHFYVTLGEDVDVSTGRYKMLSLLGQGTFGKVVEAWDRRRKQYCAVKVVRNIPKYTKDASVEVSYMQRVGAADPCDRQPFIKPWKNFLNDQGHMCIVMAKYGPCLLDFLQKQGPLSLPQIADIALQLASGLDFLHTDVRLMHTDLKPENILLERTDYNRSSQHLSIRICDLGGCTDERHSKYAIVSTRHYRAPEVLLGMGWMYPADMWSVGCILCELFTGKLLFDTHDNLEHLHIMARVLGPIPVEWAEECYAEAKPMFTNMSLRPVTSTSGLKVAKAKPLRDMIRDDLFCDLLRQLLCFDKARRLTAAQMKSHPFIMKYATSKGQTL